MTLKKLLFPLICLIWLAGWLMRYYGELKTESKKKQFQNLIEESIIKKADNP